MKQQLGVAFALFIATTAAPAATVDEYVFAFPPRDSATAQQETYQPIAALLARVAGKAVNLKITDNPMTYQRDMKLGAQDVVFDAPAFIGWRMAKLGYQPLVKIEGQLTFAIVVKKDNTRAQRVADLAGHLVCSFPPPNMATLVLFSQFNNPVRQPVLIGTSSFQEAYQGLLANRCNAAVIPDVMLRQMDRNGATRTLFVSKPLPNPGIAVSNRIPPEVRQKMTEALLSADGASATAKLRAEFGGKALVPASVADYDGLGMLLKDIWGLEL